MGTGTFPGQDRSPSRGREVERVQQTRPRSSSNTRSGTDDDEEKQLDRKQLQQLLDRSRASAEGTAQEPEVIRSVSASREKKKEERKRVPSRSRSRSRSRAADGSRKHS